MRTSIRWIGYFGVAALTGCAPLVRLAFGVRKPQAQTTASSLAYAGQLGLKSTPVAIARPAFLLEEWRDTLLYPNPQAKGGIMLGQGKVKVVDTMAVNFSFPGVMLFDGQGRGLPLTPQVECAPGKYTIVKQAVEQLNRPLNIKARKYNADFAAVAAGFTTPAGQPLRFEQVQNGSRLYVGVFGVQWWDKETRKQLALVQAELSTLPPGQAQIVYFSCDYNPEAWAELQRRDKKKATR
jgi:hypothetical protein